MDPCATLLGAPSPIVPEKGIIYQNLQWDVPPGWVSYFSPLGEAELLDLTGILLSCYRLHLLRLTLPGMEHAGDEEGTGRGIFIWHISPLVHFLTLDSAVSPSMYGMNNQVGFLELPASFSSRSRGHILFSLVQLLDRHLCLCGPAEKCGIHGSPYRFTQQLLNDS